MPTRKYHSKSKFSRKAFFGGATINKDILPELYETMRTSWDSTREREAVQNFIEAYTKINNSLDDLYSLIYQNFLNRKTQKQLTFTLASGYLDNVEEKVAARAWFQIYDKNTYVKLEAEAAAAAETGGAEAGSSAEAEAETKEAAEAEAEAETKEEAKTEAEAAEAAAAAETGGAAETGAAAAAGAAATAAGAAKIATAYDEMTTSWGNYNENEAVQHFKEIYTRNNPTYLEFINMLIHLNFENKADNETTYYKAFEFLTQEESTESTERDTKATKWVDYFNSSTKTIAGAAATAAGAAEIATAYDEMTTSWDKDNENAAVQHFRKIYNHNNPNYLEFRNMLIHLNFENKAVHGDTYYKAFEFLTQEESTESTERDTKATKWVDYFNSSTKTIAGAAAANATLMLEIDDADPSRLIQIMARTMANHYKK